MDPATAAGIALAGVSLAFDLFHGCVVGFQLLSAAHNLGKDAEFLVCMLRLEEYRLILWAKRSGLADDDLDRKFDETAIRTTLAELKELLTDAEKLKKRYKLDLRDSNVEACPVKLRKPSSAVSQFLSNNAIETAQEKILQRAKAEQRMNRLHKRLWWAAVDRKGFEELIVHIGNMVQRLFDFLSLASREETRESLHLVRLSLLSITEKVDDIRFATQDIKAAVAPDETLQTVAALRRLQINLSDPETSGSARQDSPLAYKRLFREVTAGVHGTTAFYEDVPVYVERKKYAAADIDGANAVKIAKRVEDLSKFLHVPKAPSFQSLHCIGYFQDATNSEYVFVFDRPHTAHDTTSPISLSSLLRSKQIPSQTDRFRLAAGLATTLLHLHASGWLHKGLRPQNILFFAKSREDLLSLKEPWIVGYEYARQDKTGELSDKPSQNPELDIYRHPRAQGPVSDTYAKGFDVYCLGIMLVEIAYWRSWEDLLREKMRVKLEDVNPVKMEEARKKLLEEANRDSDAIPQNLRFRMGENYAKATLQCLGTLFMDEKMTKHEFVTTFYDVVLRRLNSCSV